MFGVYDLIMSYGNWYDSPARFTCLSTCSNTMVASFWEIVDPLEGGRKH